MSTLGRIFYLNDKVIIIWADSIAHLMLYELNYPQFQRLIVHTPIHVYLEIYWDLLFGHFLAKQEMVFGHHFLSELLAGKH